MCIGFKGTTFCFYIPFMFFPRVIFSCLKWLWVFRFPYKPQSTTQYYNQHFPHQSVRDYSGKEQNNLISGFVGTFMAEIGVERRKKTISCFIGIFIIKTGAECLIFLLSILLSFPHMFLRGASLLVSRKSRSMHIWRLFFHSNFMVILFNTGL